MQNMYYIGLDVHKRTISYCVKDGSGAIHSEGTIPASSNQFLLKIQDATPLALAVRSDGSLSGPTAPTEVNGRVVTRTDDKAHKVTYASKSANCAVGVLTPRR